MGEGKDRGVRVKILEEVLELSRVSLKTLRNPEELLPAQYLEYVFRRAMPFEQPEFPDSNALEDLMLGYSLKRMQRPRYMHRVVSLHHITKGWMVLED